MKSRYSRVLSVVLASGAVSSCGLQIQTLNLASLEPAEIECSEGAAPFGGGSGTASDPYALCSPTHVQNVATALSAKYVVASDIDFGSVSSWTPIGDDAAPFTGSLNGNNKKFHHLTISLTAAANTAWVGIFQSIGTGATVSDLRLEDMVVSGNNMTGILAGRVTAATLTNIRLKSVTVNTRGMGGGIAGRSDAGTSMTGIVIDDISVSSSANGSLVGNTYDTGVGAVLGRTSGANAISSVSVTNAAIWWDPAGTNIPNWTHVGGLVGYTGALDLTDVTFRNGTITGGATYVGGVSGQWDGNGLNAAGGMTNVHLSGITVTSTGRSGGLVGNLNRRTRPGNVAAVLNASFEGTVVGGVYAGGLAAQGQFGNVERVSVKASVTSTANYAGGLFGYLIFATDVGLKDVSFAGSVSATNATSSNYVGLIAGLSHTGAAQIMNNVVVSGTITNANAASANTRVDFGAFNAGTTTNGLYHRSSTVGAFAANRSTGLSDAQMIDSSQFAGFDFANVWVMPTNAAYSGLASPVLRVMCGKNGIACP